MEIAVIIPYYQQEPGILRGAVMSAIAQVGVKDLEIIVVDDGAPAPARDDLNGLDLPAHVALRLIEQPNRGPGAARNRALDSVSPDTVYVAFLDSDDRWTADHLGHAQYALGQGFDLYFSNAAGYGESLFEGRIDVTRHRCMDPGRQLYSFVGDAGRQLISSINPVHTSTVVYRRATSGDLRFPELFMMGEDVTFWLRLARRSEKIAFSSRVECLFGEGIHVSRDSNWGTPRFIWRNLQEMRWRKWCRMNPEITTSERRQNELQIEKLRRNFSLGLLHELKKLRAFRNPSIVKFLLTDPPVICYLLPTALRVAFSRMKLRP
jgi:succinoglycan biosynthesis protein ExoW